jgi:hypothetical protein
MPSEKFSQQRASQPFSPTLWHRIRNTGSTPDTHCLDVINDSAGNTTLATGFLKIARIGHYAGQYWQFAPTPTTTSSFNTSNTNTHVLRTWWLGPNRRLNVSIGRDTPQPILLRDDGQVWTVGEWDDGTFWFSSTVGGKEKVLDLGDDGRAVVMKEKDEERPTQRWTVEAGRSISEEGYHDSTEIC